MKLFLSVAALSSLCFARVTVQTDWSGGPGVRGPVQAWGDSFLSAELTDWFDATGGLTLAREPVHLVADGFHCANQVEACDLDGDGSPDLVATSFFEDRVVWWDNSAGHGDAWAEHEVAAGFDGAYAVASADVDGDGDGDLIGGAYLADDVVWWENLTGSGEEWSTHVLYTEMYGVTDVQASDIDGDADTDIVVVASNADLIRWLENTDGQGGAWISHDLFFPIQGGRSLSIADMDGDGDVDVVVASYLEDAVSWFENPDVGTAYWTRHDVDLSVDHATAAETGDVDGDGDIDVLATSEALDRVMFFRNLDGLGGVWEASVVADSFPKAQSIRGADIDGDGDLDAVGASYEPGRICWWENTDGTGEAWTAHQLSPSIAGARHVTAADLNGDSMLDIAATAYVEDLVAWWSPCSYAFEGSAVSSILETGCPPDWGTLLWSALTPPGTSIGFLVRASSSFCEMGEWSDTLWTPSALQGVLDDADNYFQYMVVLHAVDPFSTPILQEVTVIWDPLGTGDDESPAEFQLMPVTPNPCSGSPAVEFVMPAAGFVEMEVFDVTGRLAQALDPAEYQPGWHSIQLGELRPGVYFIRMRAGDLVASERFVVL